MRRRIAWSASSQGGRVSSYVSLALASCALAGWAACGIYNASLLLPADAGAADVSPAPPPPTTDANTCNHAHWPARPSADDPGTGPASSVVLALSSLSFGAAADAGPPPLYGFDLDGVCTCPGPDSCNNAISPSPHCDEDGGRDNAGGALLTLVTAFPGLSPGTLDQSLASGRYSFLIQLKGWNGQPNDTLVTAAVYISKGLSGIADGGTVGPAKGDGTDRWTVSPDSLLGGATLDGVNCGGDNPACSPVYLDDNAYVSGGVLIGSLDFPISIGSAAAGTVSLDLTGSIIAAPLVQATGGWGIAGGVISGRWATGDLLSSLAALKDPISSSGEYLCGTDGTYAFAKTEICNAMDIAADPKLDQTGAPCDAVSLAIGFSANPAQMAEVYETAAAAQGCVSDAGTPFHDSCNP